MRGVGYASYSAPGCEEAEIASYWDFALLLSAHDSVSASEGRGIASDICETRQASREVFVGDRMEVRNIEAIRGACC